MSRLGILLSLGWILIVAGLLPAEDPKPEKPPAATAPGAQSVEQVAAAARKSVVVITFVGRDGKSQGLGTGFIVATDGLIATNLHVLGDARPISVQLANGQRHDVTSIHASDRSLDLALIRIDAKNLPALELGDAATLKEGQPVVALGNPHGLTHSVVSGVVSGKRTIEGRSMIQLAIPIEQGNSGGPLLDMQGRVQGIITMKSLVTANLGFAVAIEALKPLLKKPNPIPMSRWLTFGALDPAEWSTLFGARWRQRAGRIQVEGQGSGFGGRSLCLSQRSAPALPFEVAVTVRLDDESGAAGLVFHADGQDKHYGFYPSAGQLRLTRFEGPDVFSWKVLRQEPSTAYHQGEWNTLKVRIGKDKLECFVNDQLVIESTDHELGGGKVGLAKFRETKAEFKEFRVAKELRGTSLPADQVTRITKAVEGLPAQGAFKPGLVESLLPEAPASMTVLRDRAKALEAQAAQLRELAQVVHQKRVQGELARMLQQKDDEVDLVHAALLLANLDNDELDVKAYRKEFDRLARGLAGKLPKDADEKAKLTALNKYLFEDQGFHGSRSDYYNRSNSYLNDVLDDREGLPITLSIVYMELARRIRLHVVGIGLPGHFVVKHLPADGEGQLVDVYEGGKILSQAEAERKVQGITGRPLQPEQLAAVNKRAILVRMLHNLLRIASEEGNGKDMLRYLDTIVAIAPDAAEERGMRARVRFQFGNRAGALEDVDWLLEHRPAGVDVDRLIELRRALEKPER